MDKRIIAVAKIKNLFLIYYILLLYNLIDLDYYYIFNKTPPFSSLFPHLYHPHK